MHFFPKKVAKLTTGKHESIFLEEVHFFVWFFPEKVHFFQEDLLEFWFLEQSSDGPLYVYVHMYRVTMVVWH